MKTVNNNLDNLPIDELKKVEGGGFWNDLGYAAGKLYAKIENLANSLESNPPKRPK